VIARIEDCTGGPALGRAEAARRLDEAHKLLDEIANMLGGHAPGVAGQRKKMIQHGGGSAAESNGYKYPFACWRSRATLGRATAVRRSARRA
jgi:hypothetical protein